MSRLTITLSERRYRALTEASAQRAKSIGQLIDERVDFYGFQSQDGAIQLVRRARASSGLAEDEAMKVAIRDANAVRRRTS